MSESTPTKSERLTDAQRKQNHIQSERQRREAVRHGFNALSEIVPGMADQGKSEVRVLTATVDYIDDQIREKAQLREQCLKAGMSEGDFEQIYRDAEEKSESRYEEQSLQLAEDATNGTNGTNGARKANGVDKSNGLESKNDSASSPVAGDGNDPVKDEETSS